MIAAGVNAKLLSHGDMDGEGDASVDVVSVYGDGEAAIAKAAAGVLIARSMLTGEELLTLMGSDLVCAWCGGQDSECACVAGVLCC